MRTLIMAILSLSLLTACGADNPPGEEDVGPNGPAGTTANNPPAGAGANIACDEDTWKAFVALHQPGSVKRYEMRIKTTASNMPPEAAGNMPEVVVTREEQVVEASASQLVVKTTTANQPAKTTTTTREQFLRQCDLFKQNGLPPGISLTHKILEERQESKAVRAGTFDCNYFKIELNTSVQGMETTAISETWVTYGDSKLASVLAPTTVYSKMHQTRVVQGITVTSQTVDELVAWQRP